MRVQLSVFRETLGLAQFSHSMAMHHSQSGNKGRANTPTGCITRRACPPELHRDVPVGLIGSCRTLRRGGGGMTRTAIACFAEVLSDHPGAPARVRRSTVPMSCAGFRPVIPKRDRQVAHRLPGWSGRTGIEMTDRDGLCRRGGELR